MVTQLPVVKPAAPLQGEGRGGGRNFIAIDPLQMEWLQQ